MEIKTFRLVWYSNIREQVIVWWSKILVEIIISNYDETELILDISNYSKIWKFFIKSKKFLKIFDVDFLSEKWLNCWKNDLNSRIKLKNWNKIYYSNSIWNYIYNQDFLSKNSNFYNNWDHHLWVYNKFKFNLESSVKNISEIDKYPNDIIFINRSINNNNIFIPLSLKYNEIIIKYFVNINKWIKSIFYIDIFTINIDKLILSNITNIIKFFNTWTYYFYNIEYNYLEKYNFDKNFILYNYHFPPKN